MIFLTRCIPADNIMDKLFRSCLILPLVHLRSITTNKGLRSTVTLNRAVLRIIELSELWSQSFLDVDCCRCLESGDAPPFIFLSRFVLTDNI